MRTVEFPFLLQHVPDKGDSTDARFRRLSHAMDFADGLDWGNAAQVIHGEHGYLRRRNDGTWGGNLTATQECDG